MWPPTAPLAMTDERRQTLPAWVDSKTTAQRIVLRSRICLLAGRERSNDSVARQLE
jgi:hypothetical protein